MGRIVIRIFGSLALLALLPCALVLSYWLTAAVWLAFIPDDGTAFIAEYRYGPWLDISLWVVWLIIVIVFGLAIRALFRLTRTRAPTN